MKLDIDVLSSLSVEDKIAFLEKFESEAKKELDAMIPEGQIDSLEDNGYDYYLKDSQAKPSIENKYFNFSVFSDIHPGIVTKVINSREIEVMELRHVFDDRKKREMGSQDWIIYKDDENVVTHRFTKRKNGHWIEKGEKPSEGCAGCFCSKPVYFYDWHF